MRIHKADPDLVGTEACGSCCIILHTDKTEETTSKANGVSASLPKQKHHSMVCA
uniref:Uncharacterized protein n=1 Tax=Solanum tuberosum TaxID=4113 RepID=M1CKW0_SOLTU